MCFSGYLFLGSFPHSWGVPTMKITHVSILCKWETLKIRQCIKYLFAPLYVCVYIYIYMYVDWSTCRFFINSVFLFFFEIDR